MTGDEPCPFCNVGRYETLVITYADSQATQAVCAHCGARGPIVASKYQTDARSAWNHRGATV